MFECVIRGTNFRLNTIDLVQDENHIRCLFQHRAYFPEIYPMNICTDNVCTKLVLHIISFGGTSTVLTT